jgi:peptidoglycan/LPS O-acetylase OafA/YrhL
LKRVSQLDSVRAIAVLAVFMHHALKLKLMWAGVDLFFILSGFLITNVLLEAKHHSLGSFFAHFYNRRARRILVPYLLTLFVFSPFFGFYWLHHWYFYFLFMANLPLPLHIRQPNPFAPFWSLAVEEQFYFFWPFIVYFLTERRLRYLCVLLVVAVPLLRAGFHFSDHWPIYTLTPFRMDTLAAGGLVCLIWRKSPQWIHRRGPGIGIALFALGLALFTVLGHFGITTDGNTRLGNSLVYEASLLVCLGFFLYALSGWHVGWLRIAPLQYIGRISYTFYLVHLGIILLVAQRLSGIPLVVASLSITILYASLSWFFIERKLLGSSQKRPSRPIVSQHEAAVS